MTAAHETYAERYRVELPDRETRRSGFDGWLVAMRAFLLLIGGMLAVSLLTVI